MMHETEGKPSQNEETARRVEILSLTVIATRNSGAEDAVREGVEGYIVPRGDVNGLADRMGRFIEDRNAIERMSRAACKRAKDFSLLSYCKKIQKALFELVRT